MHASGIARSIDGTEHREAASVLRRRCAGTLARMGLLDKLDRRNQAVADHLRAHPEAGTDVFPYAKDARARRILSGVVTGVGLVSFIVVSAFGWIGAAIVIPPLLLVTAAISRRLEYHPWFDAKTSTDLVVDEAAQRPD